MSDLIRLCGILFVLATTTVCYAADALDALLPVPRSVERHAGAYTAKVIKPSIRICPIPDAPKDVAYEAYRLTITPRTIQIEAASTNALMHARTTLRQLRTLSGKTLPACVITDWPKHPIRGMMLDTGRNYQSLESIRDLIDHLAAYKYNVFHWHICDNHGWRLESKKYPELQSEKSFSRQVGKFYTQDEFRAMVRYARERGITIIPEMDVPGHTIAFRKAFGFDRMDVPRVETIVTDLIDELCSLVPAEEMPYIHLGTDEVQGHERVPQAWLDRWAKTVAEHNRILIGWQPGLHPTTDVARGPLPSNLPGVERLAGRGSVRHLWGRVRMTDADKRPYIDSQNSFYINHVDPFELLPAAAYQQPCVWGPDDMKLGSIICVWHDDCIAETEDVARMNAVYPAVVLFSDTLWRGREKDEFSLYPRLPAPDDPRFALAADLERRTLIHRDVVLKQLKHAFPFVAQTQMRWRVTGPDGAVVPHPVAQGTIYPRHFWFPKSAYVSADNGITTADTWIWSPKTQTVGAWIDFTGFSRSEGRSRDGATPSQGKWNKHGATLTVNEVAIAPPTWVNPGVGGRASIEKPLTNEGYFYRPPSSITLKRGWNHIRMTMPKNGGWKWIGTFMPVAGTSEHPKEVSGLRYSETEQK